MNEKPAGLMTMAEYSRHRSINRSSVSRLAAKGILVMRRTARGQLVDVVASDAVLDDKPVDVEESARTVAPAAGGQQPTTYAQARTAKVVFEAKLKKLEFDAKRGVLAEIQPVIAHISQNVRALRDGLLCIPSRCSAVIAADIQQQLTDAGVDARTVNLAPRHLEALLADEIKRILVALSDSFRRDSLLQKDVGGSDGVH